MVHDILQGETSSDNLSAEEEEDQENDSDAEVYQVSFLARTAVRIMQTAGRNAT